MHTSSTQSDVKQQIRELMYDKLAVEVQRYENLQIEYPGSSFPPLLDDLCIRNVPGHFKKVNMPQIPRESEILESLMNTDLEISVTPLGNADSPVEDTYFAKPFLTYKPLRWLLDRINEKSSDRYYYYQSQDDNLKSLHACPVPSILVLPTQYLGPQQAANLWIGTQGTTSRLHNDNYDNIYIQVAGTKRIYLIPPECVLDVEEKMLIPATYNENMELVRDDAGQDLSTELGSDMSGVLFPTFNPSVHRKQGCLWVVDLEPGDVLFLPALWYHQVEILTPGVNISINYWHTPFEDERRWAAWNFTRNMARQI